MAHYPLSWPNFAAPAETLGSVRSLPAYRAHVDAACFVGRSKAALLRVHICAWLPLLSASVERIAELRNTAPFMPQPRTAFIMHREHFPNFSASGHSNQGN